MRLHDQHMRPGAAAAVKGHNLLAHSNDSFYKGGMYKLGLFTLRGTSSGIDWRRFLSATVITRFMQGSGWRPFLAWLQRQNQASDIEPRDT